MGKSKLAIATAISKKTRPGHNCFTFARMVLHDLDDDYIEIPEGTLEKWAFCAASRFLVDKKGSDMLGFGHILFFLAGVVTCAFLFKRFNF